MCDYFSCAQSAAPKSRKIQSIGPSQYARRVPFGHALKFSTRIYSRTGSFTDLTDLRFPSYRCAPHMVSTDAPIDAHVVFKRTVASVFYNQTRGYCCTYKDDENEISGVFVEGPCSPQGLVSSGRNLFLLGRMEETGRKGFLPLSSGKKWKKPEESGRYRKT